MNRSEPISAMPANMENRVRFVIVSDLRIVRE